MKCPECGEEMEEGYIFLAAGGICWRSFLCWARETPTSWSIPKDTTKLLRYTIGKTISKEEISKAYRCEKCQKITFEYTPLK